MKKFFCFVVSSFLVFNICANNSSSKVANRQTALRYLQLAKNYLVQNDWQAVKKSCEYGLQYDESVSDLHYLKALSFFNLDYPRYVIIPTIEKSLVNSEWVDYNMTNARVFYADLLCSTGSPEQAISVLDSEPLIYSSDAEYIRIKSLYQLNTEQAILKAEEKIDSARKVYPNDVRFFYLFFNYEYNLLFVENKQSNTFEKKSLSPLARKIADSFIANVPNYDKTYTDLEIIASAFAEGENQKRLLKAFNARGFNHILYPIIALDAKVISEEEALDYFLTFFNDKIESKILIQFYTMIKDQNVKNYFDQNLNAFCGTLVYDTNNNLEENVSVKYERGRPKTVLYDYTNDQYVEWQVECDFGSPKKITVFDENAVVLYGTYPNVTSIIFNDLEPELKGQTIYNIVDESYQSKPFDIVKAQEIDSTDFFVIDPSSLCNGKDLFDVEKIIVSVNIMDKPSLEREGARIRFSAIKGVPYKGSYYVDGKEYASAQFLDGEVAVIRNVDMNMDGIFETTEYYSISNLPITRTEAEEKAVGINIWGSPVKNLSLYLSSIHVDTDLDTTPDFVEEYFVDGTKVSKWDSDFDGKIDIIHEKSLKQEDGIVCQNISYLINDVVKGEFWVTVVLHDNLPILIIENQVEKSVTQGKNKNFYWVDNFKTEAIESDIDDTIEENILEQALYCNQGQVSQIEETDLFIQFVKIGQNVFARKIQKQNQNNEQEQKQNDKQEQKQNSATGEN